MLKIAPNQDVRRPHAAALPAAPARHPLELLADRAANRLPGCTATLIAGCYDPAMLMVEHCADGEGRATATWLVTIASPTTMRLEAMVEEARLDLLAEAPPDRILAHLDNLARFGTARDARPTPRMASA